jgi:hypothetical protein
MTFKENRERPLLCPITAFMALAFADNAFKDFCSPKHLLSHKLKTDSLSLEITFKSEVLQTPVFRMAEGHQISTARAWTCYSSAHALGSLSIRAGFPVQVVPYDVRRGSANILNGKWPGWNSDYIGSIYSVSNIQQQLLLKLKRTKYLGIRTANRLRKTTCLSMFASTCRALILLELVTKVILIDC